MFKSILEKIQLNQKTYNFRNSYFNLETYCEGYLFKIEDLLKKTDQKIRFSDNIAKIYLLIIPKLIHSALKPSCINGISCLTY